MKRMALVFLMSSGLVAAAFAQSTNIDFDQAVDAANPSSTVMNVRLLTILGTEVFLIHESDGTMTYVDAESGELLDVNERENRHPMHDGELIDALVGSVNYGTLVEIAIDLADRDDLVGISLIAAPEGLRARAVFNEVTGRYGWDDLKAGDAHVVVFDVETGEEIAAQPLARGAMPFARERMEAPGPGGRMPSPQQRMAPGRGGRW